MTDQDALEAAALTCLCCAACCAAGCAASQASKLEKEYEDLKRQKMLQERRELKNARRDIVIATFGVISFKDAVREYSYKRSVEIYRRVFPDSNPNDLADELPLAFEPHEIGELTLESIKGISLNALRNFGIVGIPKKCPIYPIAIKNFKKYKYKTKEKTVYRVVDKLAKIEQIERVRFC